VSTIEPVNTVPLQQFIQQVKSAENSRAKEVRLDIVQAKNIAFTLGIVMSRLHGDLERLVTENKQQSSLDDTIEIKMDGGAGWQ
jgi:hypothetical protein